MTVRKYFDFSPIEYTNCRTGYLDCKWQRNGILISLTEVLKLQIVVFFLQTSDLQPILFDEHCFRDTWEIYSFYENKGI